MDSLRRAVFYIPAEPLESVFPYPSFAPPCQHLLTPNSSPAEIRRGIVRNSSC